MIDVNLVVAIATKGTPHTATSRLIFRLRLAVIRIHRETSSVCMSEFIPLNGLTEFLGYKRSPNAT
jgi:hypothetical protein